MLTRKYYRGAIQNRGLGVSGCTRRSVSEEIVHSVVLVGLGVESVGSAAIVI